MAIRKLAGDRRDGGTCPGVWEDDDFPDDAIVVGKELAMPPVPVGLGERAVRLRKQILRDAQTGV